jgi:hypothetical protein
MDAEVAAMAGFISGFKDGLSGGPESRNFQVAGIPLVCSHCGGQEFDDGYALLNTTGLSFLGLDFANREANLLICDRCGLVQWFLSEPERT